MAAQGYGLNRISRVLNLEEIPNPTMYARESGLAGASPYAAAPTSSVAASNTAPGARRIRLRLKTGMADD